MVSLLGIINLTPDSFTGDGIHNSPLCALRRARALVHDGADLVDLGGESTRPGARQVSLEEELRRVGPVIDMLFEASVPYSIDTRKPEIAEYACKRGCVLINCVFPTPQLIDVAARYGKGIILTHSRGNPLDMSARRGYDDCVNEIRDRLAGLADQARCAGVENIILDPGIGFAKGKKENYEVLVGLDTLKELGHPILVGASRKGFVRPYCLPGTLAVHALALLNGADILRVHDVKEHKQLLGALSPVLPQAYRVPLL